MHSHDEHRFVARKEKIVMDLLAFVFFPHWSISPFAKTFQLPSKESPTRRNSGIAKNNDAEISIYAFAKPFLSRFPNENVKFAVHFNDSLIYAERFFTVEVGNQVKNGNFPP